MPPTPDPVVSFTIQSPRAAARARRRARHRHAALGAAFVLALFAPATTVAFGDTSSATTTVRHGARIIHARLADIFHPGHAAPSEVVPAGDNTPHRAAPSRTNSH